MPNDPLRAALSRARVRPAARAGTLALSAGALGALSALGAADARAQHSAATPVRPASLARATLAAPDTAARHAAGGADHGADVPANDTTLRRPPRDARDARDTLATVRVIDAAPVPTRALTGVTPGALYTGKKADAIAPSAATANVALNNTRQTFARIPGLMVWEQDAGGLQAGVSSRGLSPNRSWEFNARQNGADMASDPFGYPEAYYTPPFEAVERIEVVRGAAGLQYGPQFGGLLNYVLKQAPAGRPFAVESSQLGGSYGLYSTYTAVGVRQGDVSAYGFVNLRRGDGWRAHSGFTQGTGHLSATWAPDATRRLTLAVTRADYRLEQGGGLTEAQWAADPRQAVRSRDWFSAPWTLPTLTYEGWLGDRTHLTATAFGTFGERNSVGVISAPTVADSGRNPRRVDRDTYRNGGAELRVVHAFPLGAKEGALAAGVRYSHGVTHRDRGRGTDGAGFDLAYTAPRTLALAFDTRNAAAFSELSLEVARGVTLVPGVRVEHLRMQGTGSFTAASGTTFLPTGATTAVNERGTESLPLFALGASVKRLRGVEFYGNVSQAWRPTLFSERFPNDLVAVDPEIRSARGVSADVGARGRIGDAFVFDVSGFHLRYDGRIGTLNRASLGADSLRFPNGLRTNVGRSRHYGYEAFGELDVMRLAGGLAGDPALARRAGSASVFASVGRTVAEYVAGPAAGREVEHSPDWIVRGGLSYRLRDAFTANVQASHVSAAFSDASNTVAQANGLQGIIPAYRVWDAGLTARLVAGARLEVQVNNLLDARYFTRRATGYPGPGIIPAEPRMVMAGVRFDVGGRATR